VNRYKSHLFSGATTAPVLGATLIAGVALSAGAALAADPVANSLTIYSSAQPGAIPPEQYRNGGHTGYAIPGYAVVRHEREIQLKLGRNDVRFIDVAGLIDPTTVSFQSLTDPTGTRVVEQNFQFDLVSTEKLLQKFIDRDISVEQARGDKVEIFSGTLLSTSGGLVLREADGSVRTIPGYSGVKLPSLPGGLITRPTLVWDVSAKEPGKQLARVAYQTSGITWWADYNLTYAEGTDANSCKLDVGAWVSILNQSGASYPDARIKLIAGDVHRAPTAQGNVAMAKAMRAEAVADEVKGFEEKTFFEYHLYTLGRPSSLPDNSTKQIELFPQVAGVACEKTLVYYGQAGMYAGYGGSPYIDRNFGVTGNKKVDTYLSFKNTQDNGMGVPMPAGRVRVSKLDPADGSLEFVGEDRIDHTPKNETILLKLGSAFDVVGERRQVDFNIDTTRKVITEEIEVKIRNRKDEPVKVVVKENLYRWVNWKIVSSSAAFEKQDAHTIHIPVTVPADKEAVVRYTVRYTW
jgi:hypothetical protein